MPTEKVTVVHDDGPRRATYYPVTPPPYDPELVGRDITLGWPLLMLTLLLVPPLGALQLSHRTDVPIGLRVAISLLSLVVVGMTWAVGLQVLPRS
jgi:hypothetical protein